MSSTMATMLSSSRGFRAVLVVGACVVGCGDNTPDWIPERETVGTFTGELGDVCACSGGPPFEVSCCHGEPPFPGGCADEQITIELSFNNARQANVRYSATEPFHRNGVTGYVDLVAWFGGDVIADPQGGPAQFRPVGIDHAVAALQPLRDIDANEIESFSGFTLDDFRIWCRVTR
jgi:hypothetical protein